MKRPILFLWGITTLVAHVAEAQPATQSNAAVLNTNEEVSTFVNLLNTIGLSPAEGKIIFAPVNEAWAATQEEDPELWTAYSSQPEFVNHLRNLITWHLSTEEELTNDQIWSGGREYILNALGNMTLTYDPQAIDGVPRSAISSSTNTTDGRVNVISQVIWPPYLRDGIVNQLFDDRNWKYAYTTMANLILHAGMEDRVDKWYDNGLTFLCPPNRRFNRDEINIPNLLTKDSFDYLQEFIKSHMVRYMHPSQKIWAREETQYLLITELGTHLWVTTTEYQIRFQSEKTLIEDLPSQYGLIHIVDMPLPPPSIRDFTDFTWKSTDQDTSDCMKFFVQTAVDSRRLAEEVAVDYNSKLTMFCPTRQAFDTFNREDFGRLLEPIWKRHATEFLYNMLTLGAHTRAELVAKAPSTITFLNNKTYDLRRTGEAVRIKNGPNEQARSWFGDLIATDGFLHITDKVITPTAVSRSVFDQTQDNPDFSLCTENILYVDLQDMIDRDLPLTFLAPYDTAWWRVQFGALEGAEIIKRHLFRELYFCDVIANHTGTEGLEAVNGEVHIVEARGENEENLFVGGAYIFKCDILARNGILHYVDRVIGQDYYYNTTAPSTSPAPTLSANPTASVRPSYNPAGPPPTVALANINFQTGYIKPTIGAPVFDPNKYKSSASGISSMLSLLSLSVVALYYLF